MDLVVSLALQTLLLWTSYFIAKLFSSVKWIKVRIKDVCKVFNTVVSNKKTLGELLSLLPHMNDRISCVH